MIRLHAHSIPTSLSLQQVASFSQSSCLSLVELPDGRGGGGGRGAESNDRKEAWPFINHSIIFCSQPVEGPRRASGRRTKNQRQRLIRELKTGFELAIIPVKDSAAVAQRESNDDLSEDLLGSLLLQVSLLHDQIKQVLNLKK